MFTCLKIYSDGGARGNPGPAAGAYLLLNEADKIIKAQSIYLGKRTNNQAEYEALMAALEAAAAFGADEVLCHLDSELVCRQLTGQYRVKNADLQKLWNKARELSQRFKKISFINVPRTNFYIQKADRLVNEKLDSLSANMR
jgi:ribonuclease HI